MAALAVVLGKLAAGNDSLQPVFDENGPIELAQAFCLAVTAAIFAAAFLKSTGARALYGLVAFWAIVTAMTRETPRCSSTFYDGGMCLTATSKDAIVVAAAVLCVIALVWRPLDWRRVLHPSAMRWVWPSLVVMALLAGAEVAEHTLRMTLEELLESAAYLYLAAFALWFLYHSLPGRASAGDAAPPPARPQPR
jgi:hypothetical protein